MRAPDWFPLVLLSLAAFRTWRLVGRDTILDWPRHLVVGLPMRWKDGDAVPPSYREHLAVFVECFWCAGFWNALAWWGAWEACPRWTLIVAAPFAISALLAAVAKHLDD